MHPRTLALSIAAGLGVLHCASVSPNENGDIAHGNVALESGTVRLHEIWKNMPTDVLLLILLYLPTGLRERTMVHLHRPGVLDSIPHAMVHGDPFIVLRTLAGPARSTYARHIGPTLSEHTQGLLALTALMAHMPVESMAPFIAKNNPYAIFTRMISDMHIDKKELLPHFYDLASFALRIGRVGMLRLMADALAFKLQHAVLEHYIREENAAMVEAMGLCFSIFGIDKRFFARLPSLENAAARIIIGELSTANELEYVRSALESDRQDIAAMILCSGSPAYAPMAHFSPALLDELRSIVPNVDLQWLTPAQTCRHAQALHAIGERGRAKEVLTLCLNHPQGTDLLTAFIAGVDILGPVVLLANLDIARIGCKRAMFYALAAASSSEGARRDALETVGTSIGCACGVSAADAIGAGIADKEYLLSMIVGAHRMQWTDSYIRSLAFKFTTETAVRCVRHYYMLPWMSKRIEDLVMPLLSRCVALAVLVTEDARDILMAYGLPYPPLKPRCESSDSSSSSS